jgi:hypothetical protein
MTYRALRFSRRIVAGLAALALLGGAALPTPTEAEPAKVPAPQNRTYYSNAAKTNAVGQGQWTCQLTYVQFWGVSTAYYNSYPINCDVDPEW